MQNWKEQGIRAFKITLENGIKTSLQGPGLDDSDVVDHIYKHHAYVKSSCNKAVHDRRKNIDGVVIEEYFQHQSIQQDIDAQLRQIEICQQRIKELETELLLIKT
jgi:hypothetical protein